MKEKTCKYAKDFSGDCYECEGYYRHIVECPFQYKDLNPDGSMNIVECKKHKIEEKINVRKNK